VVTTTIEKLTNYRTFQSLKSLNFKPPCSAIDSEEQWKNFGRMELDFVFEKNQRISLMFYWGTFDEWLEIYRSTHSELSCSERGDMAKFKADLWENKTWALSDYNETHYIAKGDQVSRATSSEQCSAVH